MKFNAMRLNKLTNRFALGLLLVCCAVIIAEIILYCFFGYAPTALTKTALEYQYLDRFRPFMTKYTRSDGTAHIKSVYDYKSFSFPAVRASDTFRIFVVGTSLGEQWNNVDAFEFLNTDKNIELINCAMPAFNIERSYDVFCEVLDYEPDLILFISTLRFDDLPFGFNAHLYYINALLGRLYSYRFLQDCFSVFLKSRDKSACGMDDGREVFAKYLQDMSAMARARKVPVVVCTIPLNLKDCAPAATANVLDFGIDYWRGEFARQSGDITSAVSFFSRFAKQFPDEPMAHFKLGQMLCVRGDIAAAEKQLRLALELESFNIRTKPKVNRIMLQSSESADSGFIVADLEKAFLRMEENTLPGREVFFDDTHWSEAYDSFVLSVIARSIFDNADKFPYFSSVPNHRPVVPELSVLPDAGNPSASWDACLSALFQLDVVYSLERALCRFDIACWHDKAMAQMSDGVIEKMFNDYVTGRRFMFEKSLNMVSPAELRSRMYCVLGESFRRRGLYLRAQRCFLESVAGWTGDGIAQVYFYMALNYKGLGEQKEFLLWLDKAQKAKLENTGKGIKDIEEIRKL